ncbi:MAG: peptidylprolyl isomerase [Alphaproteobacteria bacterium]
MKRAFPCLVMLMTLVAAGPVEVRDVQSIAAVVNDDIISVLDITERLKLVIFSSNLEDSPEIRQRLLPAVLRTLIDERLQIQEAERINARITDAEIEAALARILKRNEVAEGSLDTFFAEEGISKDTVVAQVRATIAWSKVIRRRIRPDIDIGEDEVDEALAHMEAIKDKPQNLVAEIFLAVDYPEQDAQVRETAERLVAQIRKGADFPALARQFSQSGTALAGGDIGWVREGELDEELEAVLAKMRPPAISVPIRTVTGYHILLLRDRQVPAGSQTARVWLRQIYFPLPPGATKDEIASQIKLAKEMRPHIKSCDDMEKLGAELGSPLSGDLGWINVGDLPEHLRKVVETLKVRKVSQPVQTKAAISVLMVCDRKEAESVLPDRDEVSKAIFGQRLDLMARRYLRDLRRSATVEMRI